jgi:hypothetical protein
MAGVLAALGVQQRFGRLRPELNHDEPLNLRIGISTGGLVVTRAGNHDAFEYAGVGDPARVADLLQQLASPGVALISDTTRRAVDGHIETVPSGSHGAAGPVFRVVGLLSRTDARSARFARTLAPYVGRRHELALLGDLASRVHGGKGQVVSIVGEPGIGKSRLLHECAQHVAAPAGMAVLEGGASPTAAISRICHWRISFGPIAASVSDRQRPSPAVERTCRNDDLPFESGTWLLRVIAAIDTSSALKARARKRSRRARSTHSAPCSSKPPNGLRSSSPSKTSIGSIDVRRVPGDARRAACRRADHDRHDVSSRLSRSVARSIMPRADYPPPSDHRRQRAARRFRRGRAALPEAASTSIVEKGEGNPLFLEELARAVVERGAVSTAIPGTVQGVIMARVDRLTESAKHVLQTASVLGREVPLQLLDRVWRGGDYAVELEELCRLEFLYEKPGADEPAVIFKHALTQDVA